MSACLEHFPTTCKNLVRIHRPQPISLVIAQHMPKIEVAIRRKPSTENSCNWRQPRHYYVACLQIKRAVSDGFWQNFYTWPRKSPSHVFAKGKVNWWPPIKVTTQALVVEKMFWWPLRFSACVAQSLAKWVVIVGFEWNCYTLCREVSGMLIRN